MKKLVLAVPLILFFGCKKPGELYCQTHADCAKWGLDFCDINGEYPASEGIAPTCIDNPFDAGAGDASVEDAAGDAHAGCTVHSECATGVCNEASNTCAEPSTVVYVDGETGEDAVGCGVRNSPCRSMSFGVLQVAGDREFVRVAPGTYVDDDIVIDGRRVHIVAEDVQLYPINERGTVSVESPSSTTIEGITSSGFSYRCGGSSILVIRHAEMSGFTGGTAFSTGSCEFSLEDSVVRGTSSEGLSGNHVTVRRSVITGFQLGFSGSGFVMFEESLISDNSVGGFEYYPGDTGEVVLRNNVLTGNGNPNGFSALSLGVRDFDAVVEHNTIIGNVTPATGAAVGCSSSGTGTVRLVGNIIYDNTGGASVSIGTGCSITYSNVEGGAPGVGNINADPEFLAGDYHLEESSPCIDRVPSEVTVDIDGEARPGGGMNDMGADEVP